MISMFRIVLVILKKKKYVLVAGITALVMAGFSYYLSVVNVLHKSILIFAEMNGVLFTIVSVLSSFLIAILFGLYLALLVLRRDLIKARARASKASGFGGATLGLLASGCPSCGAPLLGLFGLPLGLFSLPFRGIELKIASIIALLLSVYLVEKNIKKNLVCQVMAKQV